MTCRPANLSLRAKLVLLVAGLLTSIAAFLMVFLPARIESRSRRLVEARAQGIAALLASSTAPALEFDDRLSAEEHLSKLAST